MSTEEKRECDRRPIQKPVDFALWGRAYRGLIENTSYGGVFIKTKRKFPEGQDVSMLTEYPGEKRTGTIVRVTSRGIGVEFTSMDMPDINQIREIELSI